MKIALLLMLLLFLVELNKAVVTKLNDMNFGEFIERHKEIVIKFTVTWCEHCKTLDAIFKDINLNYILNCTLAEIDAEESPLASKFYNITEYPTLLVVTGKYIYRYNWEDEIKSVVKFIKRVIDPYPVKTSIELIDQDHELKVVSIY